MVPRPDEPYQYLPGFCLASATNSCHVLAPSALVMVTDRIGVDSRHTAKRSSGLYGTFRTPGVIAMTAVGESSSV
jgi:hypothetical protein